MSIAIKFENFCTAIRIPNDVVENISYRYKRITKQLNKDFWDTESEVSHSLYVGSYGRDTDIHVSDIDILFQLPYAVYEQYNNHEGNGQSALLQAVRNSLKNTYKTSYIKSDGQVIGINFKDGINFEIVPAFINKGDSYTYPDSNDGGKWRITNPKPEIEEIRKTNNQCKGNLKNLCRMTRAWKDKWDVPIGGLLIDTLAYQFIKDWKYNDKSFLYYAWITRDFFEFAKNQDPKKQYWFAPGSSQYVYRKGDFEYKAKQAYNIALEALECEGKSQEWLANQKWREIYGTKFPS